MNFVNMTDNTPEYIWAMYHKELWTWLADNPTMYKRSWPRWTMFRPWIGWSCFPCHYAELKLNNLGIEEVSGKLLRCAFCPIRELNCEKGGLFDDWLKARSEIDNVPDKNLKNHLNKISSLTNSIAQMWVVDHIPEHLLEDATDNL
jgi:hypothetical protein